MQKIIQLLLILFIVLATSSFTCNKEPLQHNIDLKSQSLDVVERHISGKWQLLYAVGGFSGNSRMDFRNQYITFNDDKILWTRNDTIIVNTTIKWEKVSASYIMLFSDTRGYPDTFLPLRIEKDELVLSDYMMDGYTYRLKRPWL